MSDTTACSVCLGCGVLRRTLRCGRCCLARYCSVECQLAHRPTHRSDCISPSSRSVSSGIVIDTARHGTAASPLDLGAAATSGRGSSSSSSSGPRSDLAPGPSPAAPPIDSTPPPRHSILPPSPLPDPFSSSPSAPAPSDAHAGPTLRKRGRASAGDGAEEEEREEKEEKEEKEADRRGSPPFLPVSCLINHKSPRPRRDYHWFFSYDGLYKPFSPDDCGWDPRPDFVQLCSYPMCASVVGHLAAGARCPPEWACGECRGRSYCSRKCRDTHAGEHRSECSRVRAIDVSVSNGVSDGPAWWREAIDPRIDLVGFAGCLARGAPLVDAAVTFWDMWARSGNRTADFCFGDAVEFAQLRVLLSTVAGRVRPSLVALIRIVERTLEFRHPMAHLSEWVAREDRVKVLLADLVEWVDMDLRPLIPSPPPVARHFSAHKLREHIEWIRDRCNDAFATHYGRARKRSRVGGNVYVRCVEAIRFDRALHGELLRCFRPETMASPDGLRGMVGLDIETVPLGRGELKVIGGEAKIDGENGGSGSSVNGRSGVGSSSGRGARGVWDDIPFRLSAGDLQCMVTGEEVDPYMYRRPARRLDSYRLDCVSHPIISRPAPANKMGDAPPPIAAPSADGPPPAPPQAPLPIMAAADPDRQLGLPMVLRADTVLQNAALF